MCAQREISFDDVFDQIREHQIEVAKLADDNPFKPVLRKLFALSDEITEILRDDEPGEFVDAMQALIREGALSMRSAQDRAF
jgi:hypothetical protein